MNSRLRSVQMAVAVLVLYAASFALFILLLPVPAEFAKGISSSLTCDFFAASRRGWGCARWGDVTKQPAATLLASLACVSAAIWLRTLSSKRLSLFVILAFPLGLFSGLAAVLRIIYYVLGTASEEYLLWTIPIVTFSAMAFCFLWMVMRGTVKSGHGFAERDMRRKDSAFQRGIDVEIAERKFGVGRGKNESNG